MNRPLNIFNTGKQVRDIIYAPDVARAFHAFYEHGEPGIYNIGGGPDYAISLIECIDLIGEITGTSPKINFAGERHGDLLYFVCDTKKAQTILQWTPRISPEKGVRELIDWIKKEKDLFRKDIQ